ncbi:MAG: polysaccharide deacetylase family protein [Bacteroidota bacterium]
MRWYPHRTPGLLPALFPGLLFSGDKKDRTLYLTFDDGPDPEATPLVLDWLDRFDAKATFFMVGDRVLEHPEVVTAVVERGHQLGNHTQHHVSGWQTSVRDYVSDVAMCQRALQPFLTPQRPLYRPPYGRMTLPQMRLLAKDYRIVMWSLLSGDFDPKMTAGRCLRELAQARSGDIIVFHDSSKFQPIVQEVLPQFLERFHDKGFKFAAIR